MKKGFTLAELVGVVIILGLITLIAIPIVDGIVKQNKEDRFNDQIKSIELATQNWLNENTHINLEDGDTLTLTLLQLKQEDLIDKKLINPMTSELFNNDMLIKITKNNGLLSYTVDSDSGTKYDSYNNAPSIILNGSAYEVVNLGDSYTDLGVVAKTSSGTIINSVTIEPSSISLDTLTTYTINYSVTDSGITSKVIRNVKVVDKESPTIELTNKYVTLTITEVDSYNLLTGVSATDNSGVADITYEGEIKKVKGKYTITYIARDSSGNETRENRIITVTE